jgi:hypothetical protein
MEGLSQVAAPTALREAAAAAKRQAWRQEGRRMWYFRAIAFDLDGTLTTTDAIAVDTLSRLRDARSDRALLLVTGRIDAELNNAFPQLANRFD